jgi:hypothetical protein
LPPPAPQASLSLFRPEDFSHERIIAFRLVGEIPLAPRPAAHKHGAEEAVQVEIGSGTQVASRGPTWRIATPRY